ncbi:MAG: FUSC family protein [Tepidisphaeraceae bacterium]
MIWLRSIIAAPRRTTAQSLAAASFFALQLAVAAGAIGIGYTAYGRSAGMTWAIVSAILILYPGITQSFSAAMLRIAANLLGSAIGFTVGYWAGTDLTYIIVALIITVFVGELLRMDLALRTACVATVIVMSAKDHHVETTVAERLVSVIIGCGTALSVQLAASPMRRFLPYVAKVEATVTPPAKDVVKVTE